MAKLPNQRIVRFGPDYKLSIVDEQNRKNLFEIAVFKNEKMVEMPGITAEGDTQPVLTLEDVQCNEKMFLLQEKCPETVDIYSIPVIVNYKMNKEMQMGMSGYIMDLEEDFVEEVSKRIGGCEHVHELVQQLEEDDCMKLCAWMSDIEKLDFVYELWDEYWADKA